ncbi:hypothetical protein ACQ4PT_070739 [Festuca glaucescens]
MAPLAGAHRRLVARPAYLPIEEDMLKKLGDLMNDSHCSCSVLYECSIEEDVLLEVYKRISHSITDDRQIRKDDPDEHVEETRMISIKRTLLG